MLGRDDTWLDSTAQARIPGLIVHVAQSNDFYWEQSFETENRYRASEVALYAKPKISSLEQGLQIRTCTHLVGSEDFLTRTTTYAPAWDVSSFSSALAPEGFTSARITADE